MPVETEEIEHHHEVDSAQVMLLQNSPERENKYIKGLISQNFFPNTDREETGLLSKVSDDLWFDFLGNFVFARKKFLDEKNFPASNANFLSRLNLCF